MPFVLDASVTACWAFHDEDHPQADLALARLGRDHALAPSLWWFELRNMLVVNEHRKRITLAETAAFLRDLSSLPVTLDSTPDEAEVLRLARAHRLSVYDAAYLELAQRSGVALASLDAALVRAAHLESVPVLA
ncbi:MAG: hypothetical protein QOF94_2733 [Acidobacteriaceae bacterium]|jgi:predicted nucleic acid-binding protein